MRVNVVNVPSMGPGPAFLLSGVIPVFTVGRQFPARL